MSSPFYIYRDYACSLAQKNCANFLQGLAIAGGSIVSSHVISNAFPEASVGRWTMFFRLSFNSQQKLDKFHSLGLKTIEPENVSGNAS